MTNGQCAGASGQASSLVCDVMFTSSLRGHVRAKDNTISNEYIRVTGVFLTVLYSTHDNAMNSPAAQPLGNNLVHRSLFRCVELLLTNPHKQHLNTDAVPAVPSNKSEYKRGQICVYYRHWPYAGFAVAPCDGAHKALGHRRQNTKR